jgi:hypothetical protein
MGIVQMGPPGELVLRLRETFQIRHFIETGTYEGRTAAWAAAHFHRVRTIEFSRALHGRALARYRHLPNVDFLFGDSRVVLPSILPALDGPGLFWLDGHWSGGDTYGQADECPLLGELDAIAASPHEHFILIDDARLFASPPPRPHRVDQWPALTEIFDRLRAMQRRAYIVIQDDCLICVPPPAKALVAGYCQDQNSEGWRRQEPGGPARRDAGLLSLTA